MKKLLPFLPCLAALFLIGRLSAGDEPVVVRLSASQIENLVSPIALYPDPLVALILPASTHPADIVLAARYLSRGGDPAAAVSELWDESVKSLVRYREVIDYLDRNLGWTRSLGECFLDQPDDVMQAIQAVRARAKASGLLADTREQEVVVEPDEIRILPADPTIIYVPRYDPQVVFLAGSPSFHRPAAWLSFGLGYRVGAWLSYDCDWRYRSVRIAHRPPSWYLSPDWRRGRPEHPVDWSCWAPPPRARVHRRHNHTPNFMPRYDSDWSSRQTPGAQPAATPPRHDDGRRGRWQDRPDRDRTPRDEPRRRQPREHPQPLATAPAVNATPAVPTMPVFANPPAATASRPERTYRPPENHRQPDRSAGEPRHHAPAQPAAAPRPSYRPESPPARETPRRENTERSARGDRAEDNRLQPN